MAVPCLPMILSGPGAAWVPFEVRRLDVPILPSESEIEVDMPVAAASVPCGGDGLWRVLSKACQGSEGRAPPSSSW